MSAEVQGRGRTSDPDWGQSCCTDLDCVQQAHHLAPCWTWLFTVYESCTIHGILPAIVQWVPFGCVQVVSSRNHMVFTPLLASATVGTLEPRSVAMHVHDIQPALFLPQNQLVVAEAKAVNPAGKVRTLHGSVLQRPAVLCRFVTDTHRSLCLWRPVFMPGCRITDCKPFAMLSILVCGTPCAGAHMLMPT